MARYDAARRFRTPRRPIVQPIGALQTAHFGGQRGGQGREASWREPEALRGVPAWRRAGSNQVFLQQCRIDRERGFRAFGGSDDGHLDIPGCVPRNV